jgi:hypothetical protein
MGLVTGDPLNQPWLLGSPTEPDTLQPSQGIIKFIISTKNKAPSWRMMSWAKKRPIKAAQSTKVSAK